MQGGGSGEGAGGGASTRSPVRRLSHTATRVDRCEFDGLCSGMLGMPRAGSFVTCRTLLFFIENIRITFLITIALFFMKTPGYENAPDRTPPQENQGRACGRTWMLGAQSDTPITTKTGTILPTSVDTARNRPGIARWRTTPIRSSRTLASAGAAPARAQDRASAPEQPARYARCAACRVPRDATKVASGAARYIRFGAAGATFRA